MADRADLEGEGLDVFSPQSFTIWWLVMRNGHSR